MSSRTIFLSRLIGLYCIVIALSMMTRRQATVETVTTLLQNPSMMLIVGTITLAAGLAGQAHPKHVDGSAEIDDFEASFGAHDGMAAVGADGQGGAELAMAIASSAPP